MNTDNSKKPIIPGSEIIATLSGKNFGVRWVNLGEGHNGDYDPEDPTDENLLRMDFLNADGEEINSVCTCMPASAVQSKIEAALYSVYGVIYRSEAGIEYLSRRLVDAASYLSEDNFLIDEAVSGVTKHPRRLYLEKYNTISYADETIGFTRVQLVSPDLACMGNPKAIQRLMKKAEALGRKTHDKLYWRLENGGYYHCRCTDKAMVLLESDLDL